MSVTTAGRALDAAEPDSRARLIRLLGVDAAVSGVSGLALAAGAPALDGFLGAPIGLLVPLGAFLLVYAGALVLLARSGVSVSGANAVIGGNVAWVIASVVVVLADWLTLTTAGTVFVLGQAVVVGVLAELQFMALRRRR